MVLQIEKRKEEHIKLCMEKDIQTDNSFWYDDIYLLHRAMPAIDKDKIDLSTKFLGKKINYPFVIEAMTGGCKKGEQINKNLAIAAEKLNIPIGVGSQRAMIDDRSQTRTYDLKRFAPKIPVLISNIGLVQFCSKEYREEIVNEITSPINADAIAIHLNPAQEAVQKEGDVNFQDSFNALKKIVSVSKVPVIAKETGCGMIKEDCKKMAQAGVSVIDIGGNCGTSFTYIETLRRKDRFGGCFRNWGIPTTISVMEANSCNVPIIASGGVRDGIQCAKLIRLGASFVGFALPLLAPAIKSPGAVIEKINEFIEELKIAMFLCGAGNLDELKKVPVVVVGKTKEWMEQRKLSI